MTILALCGSLRRASYNRMLLAGLAERSPDGIDVVLADIRGIPLYDGDLEAASGLPDAVTALQDRIAAADGLILGSPEYNGGVPGPLKNALDWCSRGGQQQRVFGGRPTGLVGATPGRGGTRLAQQAWLITLRQLGTRFYGEDGLYVGSAGEVFDEAGEITDERVDRHCRSFMTGFAAFVQATVPKA